MPRWVTREEPEHKRQDSPFVGLWIILTILALSPLIAVVMGYLVYWLGD